MTPTAFGLTLEKAAVGVAAEKDSDADDGDESCSNCGEHNGASPPGPAQSHLGGLREVSVTADRRKRVGQAACVCLIEADRPVEVLEPLLAEVSQVKTSRPSSSSSSSRVCVA